MALLTLKDIGKIYVSEGAVAVGIRGVNLSFEKGEFVAVTGQSGSGKSTLLNVISGMDSYEEGELFIEDQSTSHYLQREWEEYREKYISFIFQDYNIIESFTVLQNVELALMHIPDKKERRRRALELLSRVGLSSHVKQKGSRLSGGQKQRTVIARALAKDSPIILADEPTGNLDSATSKEIIELLREVSRDKLLIMVTHNFDQVEAYATRHIRIFDGAVESDHVLIPVTKSDVGDVSDESKSKATSKLHKKKNEVKNGITLGGAIFSSKPRLSTFLSFLMIVGMLGIFLVTSFCGEAGQLFDKSYMFTHIDGRVVLTTQNGSVLSLEEVERLAKDYGAKSYLRFDSLLDEGTYSAMAIPYQDTYKYVRFRFAYWEDFGEDILGRYPEKDNEIFLYLPISLQPVFGKDAIIRDELTFFGDLDYDVVGVKYYYDNNKTPVCLFNDEGFRSATAIAYMLNEYDHRITVTVSQEEGTNYHMSFHNVIPSFDMEAGKIYIGSEEYRKVLGEMKGDYDVTVTYEATYYNYDYYEESNSTQKSYRFDFDESAVTDRGPVLTNGSGVDVDYSVAMDAILLRDLMENVLAKSYRQVSLFFEDDAEAHRAAEELQKAGYIAVPSDTEYEPDMFDVILTLLSALAMAVLWVMTVFFLAFFLALCTRRTLGAFKNDMAIMRSMGISVKVIRIGMYVRMLLALIPAVILLIAVSVLIFTSPVLNEIFIYLYAWQYILIVLGMVLLTLQITRKQIKRLFSESVKKSLKGGGNA